MKLFIKRFFEVLNKIINFPEKNKNGVLVLKIDTLCLDCMWEGNAEQSIPYKDKKICPRCGNSELYFEM